MFRGQQYTTPNIKSITGTLVVSILAFIGSHYSPVIGYVLALLTMLTLIVAMYTESIWPTQAKKENIYIFCLFWGLILGTVIPFLITTFIHEGWSGVYNILTSEP